MNLDKIKCLVIKAFFSIDDLMERFVLKGGNALDIIYKLSSRASLDIDFSIKDDFESHEIDDIKEKIEKSLASCFEEEKYKIFDFVFDEKPRDIAPSLSSFWGGYDVNFKFIEIEKFKKFQDDIDALRRNAIKIGNSTKCKIDISKFEFCEKKGIKDLDGLTIYVYTPEMIIFEKLRAICQQMPDYKSIVPSHHRRARARDFFDIYTIFNNFTNINISNESNLETLNSIFSIKKVPLYWLGEIKNYRQYHKDDFSSLIDTLKHTENQKDFDFYFDYVLSKIQSLEVFWIK